MVLLDVSPLIHAHRVDSPDHAIYADWLRGVTGSPTPFALAEVVLAGFLRIVTNPRIFDPATPMDVAIRFCEQLVAHPRAVLVAPGQRHWRVFTELCREIRGPLVTDAYLAALAIEHGCELATADSDFARFPGLRWRHPLAPTE